MIVTVNGKKNELSEGTSIVMLLNQYNIGNPMTIVEINGCVVQKSNWESHIIHADDKIEIIQLMGGG